jgi:putative membrane protein
MQSLILGRAFRRQPTRREWLAAFIVRWLITAVAVWIAAQLVDGIHLEGWGSTLVVALILGLLNAFLKPLLFWGSLILSILTFGIFTILLNTALLAITAWTAGKFDNVHFAIDGFWDAFWGAVLISLVGFVVSQFVDVDRLARRFK